MGALPDADPALFTGYLDEFPYITVQIGAGKLLFQIRHNFAEGARAITALEYFAGALIELNHAFGVEQDVGLLSLLPLKPKRRHDFDDVFSQGQLRSC